MITLKGNIANLEGTSGDQKPNDVPVNTIFRELDTNCKYYFTGESWVEIPSSGGGGGGGTDSYNDLENKPQINSVTLSGNKSLANLGIQGELTFDNEPTEDSTNPVTSGGVYSALETKQNTLTIDSTPTESSTNPVESGGVYSALGNKQDTLTFDGTYDASTNKAATESTVSGAVSTAIGNLSKSDVGLDNVTNNTQVKAVSGDVTNGGIVTFGANGETVADSGKTIETSLTDTNNKIPTSKAIRDNVAANATLASGYTVDTSETSITSSTKINDAIEQLDYRTATNKNNILLTYNQNGKTFNIVDWSLINGAVGSDNNVTYSYADGIVTVTGTKSVADSYMTVINTLILTPNTNYVVSQIQTGSPDMRLKVFGYDTTWRQLADTGSSTTFNSGTYSKFMVRFTLAGSSTGVAVDKTIKPMLIEKSVYDAGFTDYQPYALPNTTITPALVECVDNGSKNELDCNVSTLTPLNTYGTWSGNTYSINSGTTAFVINSDLTLTVSKSDTGTARSMTLCNYTDGSKLNGKVISGGTSNVTIIVQKNGGDYQTYATTTGDGALINGIPSGQATRIVLSIASAVTCSNVVVKPMLCTEAEYKASQTYQPYAMNNVELTEKLVPTDYTALTPSNSNITSLSGGYFKIGKVVFVSARISINSEQGGSLFYGLPTVKNASGITTGQATASVTALAVTNGISDTNLIISNDSSTTIIGVAGSHSVISAGTYVISGFYLST